MNKNGVALIPALIGSALLGILVLAVASVTNYFSRETQSLAQKLEIIHIQEALYGTLFTRDVCGCNMDSAKNTVNTTPLRFDSTNLPAAKINFNRIFASCNGTAPANPILQVGANPSGVSSGVRVGEIALSNIQATGTPGSFYGELVVTFEASSMIMGRRPALVGVNFRADLTNPNQARITNCSTGDPNSASTANINPAGTPGSPCGAGNLGITLLQMGPTLPLQRMCCTLGNHYADPLQPQYNGNAFNCNPY